MLLPAPTPRWPQRDIASLLAVWAVVVAGLVLFSYEPPRPWLLGVGVLGYLLAASVVIARATILARAVLVLWWLTVAAVTLLLFLPERDGGLGGAFVVALVYGSLGYALWVVPGLLVGSFLRSGAEPDSPHQ